MSTHQTPTHVTTNRLATPAAWLCGLLRKRSWGACFSAALLTIGIFGTNAFGQQTVVTTPFHNSSSNFFENNRVGFGFNLGNNVTFRQNLNPGVPFGAGGQNQGGQFGFQSGGAGGGFGLNLGLGHGSSRSMTSQAPSVTVLNGHRGSFHDTRQRPFVTGLVPLVGMWPGGSPMGGAVPTAPQVYHSPLRQRWERLQASQLNGAGSAAPAPMNDAAHANHGMAENDPIAVAVDPHRSTRQPNRPSSASHGDLSVAEIEAYHAQQDELVRQEIAQFIAQGEAAEREGNLTAARAYYRQAASRSTGSQREALRNLIQALQRESR